MSFEDMLFNTDPEDAAKAAIIMAKDAMRDPGRDEAVRAIAAKILALSVEELVERFRNA